MEEPRTGEAIYQQALRSTAWVKVYQDKTLKKMGTGFLVDRLRKLVVTNQHVVDHHEVVEVVFPLYHGGLAVADKKNYIRYDRPIRGWVVAADPKRDLAVIELEVVPHAATAMRLAADSPCPGEQVHLIGDPGTSESLWVHITGRIHQVSPRKLEDHRFGRVLDAQVAEIRTRAAIKPGYSGGPVINDRGELAGVATMSNPAANWAWCVDITQVRDVLRMVREHPKAARRLLNPRSPSDHQDRAAYDRQYGPADHAIADWSEILRGDAQNARAYLHRGAAYSRRGQWGKAIADFTAALRLDSTNALVIYNRALAYSQMGSLDQALADFEESLRIDAKNDLAFFDRGLLYSRMAMHDLAISDFDQALRLGAQEARKSHENGPVPHESDAEGSTKLDYTKLLLPEQPYAAAYNTLAWVLATSPDASRRDGKKAVEYATKACELSAWKDGSILSTLAAAHAECTNFAEAIRWEKRALEVASQKEKAALRARLQLYQTGKPFRAK